MSSAPAVSIAIATFNRAALLPRAIASVRRQTVRDIEILVVDDGSSDNTAQVIAEIGDARIRYLRHSQNQGLPAARNTAIRAASGRYIAFLDDDDEWLKHKLERQLKFLQRFDAVLCAAFVNDRQTVKTFPRTIVTTEDLRKGNAFDPSTLIVEAQAMRQLMFDESLRVGEDWDAFIRLAANYRMGYVQEPLIIYHEQLAGRMTAEAAKLSVADLERRMSMLHKHRDFFGPFWFNYHIAAFLLSHIRNRADKAMRLSYAVRRCGALPVMRLLLGKAARRWRAAL
jgi:glycosyltransferase involved in cell wall biosynthesis